MKRDPPLIFPPPLLDRPALIAGLAILPNMFRAEQSHSATETGSLLPHVVCWYLWTALVLFLLALAVGVAQSLSGVLPFLPPGLTPVNFHLLLVGWITQFILGVASWMLPKYCMERPREIETLSWVTYILLNAGLLLRALGEPMTIFSGSLSGWGLVVSALFQMLGCCMSSTPGTGSRGYRCHT